MSKNKLKIKIIEDLPCWEITIKKNNKIKYSRG
jgi:hypothetical protein